MMNSLTQTVIGRVVIVLGIIIILLLASFFFLPKSVIAPKDDVVGNDMIHITFPSPDALITDRVIKVSGEARGSWFFEASAPVFVLNESGERVLSFYMMTADEWMTTDFISFSGEGVLSAPLYGNGWIVFAKDNPSGLPEYAQEFRIPVTFDVK